MSKQRHLIPNITGGQSVEEVLEEDEEAEEEEDCDRNVLLYVRLVAVNTEAVDEPFFDPVWIFCSRNVIGRLSLTFT